MEAAPEPLSESMIAELKESFVFFDVNHDGFISLQELGPLLRSLGQNPTQTDIQDVMKILDKDVNGKLDFEEFKGIMSVKMKPQDTIRTELREAFRMFDKDDNGYVSLQEMQEVLTSVGDKLSADEIAQMIEVADVDKDGRLNYDEFVNVIMQP